MHHAVAQATGVVVIDRDEMKELTKQAINEWLDQKFSEFGKWSLGGFAALVFAGLVYFVLKMNGWHQ